MRKKVILTDEEKARIKRLQQMKEQIDLIKKLQSLTRLKGE